MSFIRLFSLFFLLSFLAACGGSGSDSGTDKPDNPTDKDKVKTLRVATFGDSTADASSLTAQDISLFQASLNGHQLIASRKYQLSFYYPAAYLVGNGGIGGETTAGMIHRDVEPVSIQRKSTEDIIALKPQVILFRGGSINDLPNVNKNNRASIVNETYTHHITLLERFTTADLPVLDSGIFGYSFPKGGMEVGGYSKADPTQVRLALTELNNKFRTYAKTHDKVYFVDPVGVVSDTKGKYFFTMTEEGIHLSLQGSLAMAKKEAEVVAKIFGESVEKAFEKGGKNNYPKINPANNPLFKATDSATKDMTKVVRGKQYQFIKLKNDGGLELKIPEVLANSLAKGKIYGVSLDIIIEKPSTPIDFKLSTRLDLRETVNGSRERYLLENFGGDIKQLDHQIAGRIKLPPFKLNTTINDQSHFRIYLSELSTTTALKVGVTALTWVELPPQQ